MNNRFTIAGQSYLKPLIMGILNCTPDSFSDDGVYFLEDRAVAQAKKMLAAGATIIDIGGESTRPGADAVGVDEELRRVIAPIQAIKSECQCLVSIDTHKAQVMTKAVAVGADIINDVNALRSPGSLEAAASCGVTVCLMHMRGDPKTMQQRIEYKDVVTEVLAFFEKRITACEGVGIKRDQIMLDPGFGFGKTLEHNYQLLNNLDKLEMFGMPVLAGLSRKSMIGNLLGREVHERLAGSLAAACMAVIKGAQIIRVHDVQDTADAIAVMTKTIEA